MDNPLLTTMLLVSAVCCIGLGALVLARNVHRLTHRAFALMAVNLGLWAVGVSLIINCHTQESARFWVVATFIVASFIPTTYQFFISIFPGQRFTGYRWLMWVLLLCSLLVSLGTFTPWYVTEVRVFEFAPPEVRYGPVFAVFALSVALSMGFGFPVMIQKLRRATGVERRQVQHIMLGTIVFTVLASATNLIGPMFDLQQTEAYGPVFLMPMVVIYAYAMVRYHLLDVWIIVSRTTVYAVTTALVALAFLGTTALIHWISSHEAPGSSLPLTLAAALVVVLIVQPLKEHLQLFVDQLVLKRGYDVQRLLARVSQHTSQIVQLDQLLHKVADDIADTVGVDNIRVLLSDERNPTILVTEFSTKPEEHGQASAEHGRLLDYLLQRPAPLSLEEMVHSRPTEENALVAEHLADLDAYLCVPLRTSSGLVGVLTLGRKASRDIYTTDDLMVFTALAGPLATAIENGQLYRKLEDANLHRSQILSNMRGGVVAVDTAGRIQTVNEAATEILGPLEPGRDVESLQPQVARLLQHTLQTGRGVRDFEAFIRREDGEDSPVAMSSSCLSSQSHGRMGAMVMIYDLSQVKRLEQNVQRADRLSSIGTLAAGMAHEIKNPLVSIKTFAQLLPTRYEDADFRSTFAEVVLTEVERINSIVTGLLDFARPKKASFAVHNVCGIVQEVLTLVENQARKGDISIDSDFVAPELMIYGDEQQLHQVFLNLVLNAIDAMGHTSEGLLGVSIALGRMHTRNNRLAPLLDVESVQVTITDTGCGIPSETLERIFTPFYTTKENGSGLGLSVVHGIVTEHGGEIDVKSAMEEGTAFTVTLPLAREEVAVEGVSP